MTEWTPKLIPEIPREQASTNEQLCPHEFNNLDGKEQLCESHKLPNLAQKEIETSFTFSKETEFVVFFFFFKLTSH